jgi:hypothetical protein
MSIGLHVKYYLFLSDFSETQNLSAYILKNTQILNFMKIQSVGAELFRAGRRTNTKKQIVTFCNFANVPNKTKEREQKIDIKVVCAATESSVTRRVTAAHNRSFYINRIRPK